MQQFINVLAPKNALKVILNRMVSTLGPPPAITPSSGAAYNVSQIIYQKTKIHNNLGSEVVDRAIMGYKQWCSRGEFKAHMALAVIQDEKMGGALASESIDL